VVCEASGIQDCALGWRALARAIPGGFQRVGDVGIYRNPAASIPDYRKADPLLMHVAYASDNPAADCDRLVQAGAAVVDELTTTPAGDAIVMLRDPWGVPIQLVKRAKPML
jgi:glyoxylase I family protein